MKRWAIGIAALLLVLAGGWLWGSPYWTLAALEKAADRGDLATLSAHVDYPALRANLKQRLRHRADAPQGSGLEMLGAALMRRFSDPLVDTLVTPEGMRLVFASREADAATERRPALKASEMRIRRDGIARFSLRPAAGEGALIFRLRGTRWMLTEVELP